MNRGLAQKVVVTGAVIITVLALLFPPWVQTLDVGVYRMTLPYRGHYAPIYSPPDPEPLEDIHRSLNKYWSIQVDIRRLGSELCIIVVVAAFALYLLRPKVKPGP